MREAIPSPCITFTFFEEIATSPRYLSRAAPRNDKMLIEIWMLKKNTIYTGILIGLILPVLTGIAFEIYFTNVWLFGKKGMPYLIVILVNMLILRYFAKKGDDKTMQGVMLVTFVFAVLVFMFRFNV